MFFGEFLVTKKAISEDQLLDALTYQVEHLPSFMRVLREEKIIPSSDLFQLIKVQMETNSDLVGVLRDENKIDGGFILKRNENDSSRDTPGFIFNIKF